MKIEDLEALDSYKAKEAKARLQSRVRVGAKQQQVAIQKAVETVIVDRLYYPAKMIFVVSDESKSVKLAYETEEGKLYHIHNHAMSQMAEVCGLPHTFASKLRNREYSHDETKIWELSLLTHNFNTLFHERKYLDSKGKPYKYLRRAVGNQVRGFQGKNFKRSLRTADLLRVFVEECAKYRAEPVEAWSTDVKTTLKCVLPFVFEPIPGEFVAFGETFGNSDFGAGRLSISSTLMRISSGTIQVLEDAMSKIHLGKVIEGDDNVELSNETLEHELDTHKSGLRDVVAAQFGVDNIKSRLDAVRAAHEAGIDWYKLRGQLIKVLNKKGIEFVKALLEQGDDLMDLPPVTTDTAGNRKATNWWAANVVGWMANKEPDEDKKYSMQQLAGELIAA